MAKRVLVTGGTGFIGANLLRRLLAEGHEVHALVRPSHDPSRLQGIELRLHQAELQDSARVVQAVKPDWVFHLAAHGQYSWQTDVTTMLRTNVEGTATLLMASLDVGCQAFVNAGSSSEYGFKDHAPSEDEPLEPNSWYAATKGAATSLCRFAARQRGAHVVTLRLYSAFGLYEHAERLLPTLIRHGREGRLPPLVNPDMARDFVYIEDVIDAFLLAAGVPRQEPGVVYNVGTGVQTTIHETVEVARRLFGLTVEPEWGTMADRAWDTPCWVANSGKIRERLGWRPKHTFEEGFRKMAAVG